MEINNNFSFSNVSHTRSTTDLAKLSTKLEGAKNSDQDVKSHNDGLKKVSRDFEALFVKQLLKDSRKTYNDGGLFEKSVMREFNHDIFDDKMSGFVADSGGIGIAKIIYDKYKK